MKAIISLLLSLSAICAFADDNLGKKIEFSTIDGKPQFGVQMTGDQLFLTFTLNGSDLTENRDPILSITARLNDQTIVNSGSPERSISGWQTLYNSSTGAVFPGTQAFTFSLAGGSAKLAVKNLKTLILEVSSMGRGHLIHTYIDLGTYCSYSPDHFLNLDTGAGGCK